jgi:hypothetical protein
LKILDPIRGTVDDPNYLKLLLSKAIKDQVFFETLDLPDPKTGQRWLLRHAPSAQFWILCELIESFLDRCDKLRSGVGAYRLQIYTDV